MSRKLTTYISFICGISATLMLFVIPFLFDYMDKYIKPEAYFSTFLLLVYIGTKTGEKMNSEISVSESRDEKIRKILK